MFVSFAVYLVVMVISESLYHHLSLLRSAFPAFSPPTCFLIYAKNIAKLSFEYLLGARNSQKGGGVQGVVPGY